MNSAAALTSFIADVCSYAGLSARTDPVAFGRVVAPHGPPSAVAFLCSPMTPGDPESSCEVFAIGACSICCEKCGIDAFQAPLDATGATGEWVRARGDAMKRGALRTPKDPGAGLREGCVLHAEDDHSRHWMIVVKNDGFGRWRVVAGGALDGLYQSITESVITIQESSAHGLYWSPELRKCVVEWIDMQAILELELGAETEPDDAPVEG